MMDAKGARYAKLDALFEKHSDIHSNLTEELKAAKAAPAPTIAEQMAPSAEEAAATATHAKLHRVLMIILLMARLLSHRQWIV